MNVARPPVVGASAGATVSDHREKGTRSCLGAGCGAAVVLVAAFSTRSSSPSWARC